MGKRLLYIPDATNAEISVMLPDIKKVSGGDPIKVLRTYKTSLSVLLKLAIIITSNEDISFENDIAFLRRVLFIECQKVKNPEPGFVEEILQHEASFLTIAIKSEILLSRAAKDFSKLPRGVKGVSELAFLLQEKFFLDQNFAISLRDVKAVLGKDALKSLGLAENQVASRVINSFFSSFNVQVTKVRRNFGFSLKGFRERREKDGFMMRVDQVRNEENVELERICDRVLLGQESLEDFLADIDTRSLPADELKLDSETALDLAKNDVESAQVILDLLLNRCKD